MYVIKIGGDYLGTDGTLTQHQKDALRVDDSVKPAVNCYAPADNAILPGFRLVRLRTRNGV